MARRTRLLAVLLLLALAPPTRAAEEIADLIPADALGAFGIRNVDELRKKGDGFLKAAGIENDDWRISKLVASAYQALGIQGGVDESGRVLVVATREGKPMDFLGFQIVVLIPFKDLDAMAANFGFKKGELKRDTLTAMPREGGFVNQCYVRGNHMLLGMDAKAVMAVAQGKRAGPLMTPAQRQPLDNADMVLYLGTETWGDVWKQALAEIKKDLQPGNDREARVADQLLRTFESVHFVALSARIEEGLSLRLSAGFSKDLPPDVVAFLKTLGAGSGPSSLRGLATGKVIAAFASRADGSETAVLARLLLTTFFRNSITANNLFIAADQPLVASVFANLWSHVQGRRLALYQNSDETRHGLFSVVAILDSDDPKKLMSLIGDLARFAAGKDLDLSDKSGKETVQAIEKLVRDLGDEDFETREAATLKLTLIGEPALLWLQKAAMSDDAEVRRRAEPLVADIKERAALRRKELLNADAPRRIRPGFVLAPAAEMLDGQVVDVVHVKLGREDAGSVAQMKQLLGPDWTRIRLATVGKQIVVLVGSDVDLFRRTLANVQQGAGGLTDDPALAGFLKQADRERSLELHFAMQSLQALTAPEGLDPTKLKAGQLSSLSVRVDAGRFEVQLWVPPQQFTAVARGLQLLP